MDDDSFQAKISHQLKSIPDQSPQARIAHQLKGIKNDSPQARLTAQLQSAQQTDKPATTGSGNTTGMPDQLKSGVEQLSGIDMSDVKVHYNSDQPAQLQAHAFAKGTDIHIAPNQQQHLPHEAWHVVQQKQGRVKPTIQMKSRHPCQ